jgi:hypothetical protein
MAAFQKERSKFWWMNARKGATAYGSSGQTGFSSPFAWSSHIGLVEQSEAKVP